jgi:hypothetical protein
MSEDHKADRAAHRYQDTLVGLLASKAQHVPLGYQTKPAPIPVFVGRAVFNAAYLRKHPDDAPFKDRFGKVFAELTEFPLNPPLWREFAGEQSPV